MKLFSESFRPRWTCIQCTMQTALADAFGNRSHPGICKNDFPSLVSFVPFLCVLLFSGIRHTRFCSLFPPPARAPPRHPMLLPALICACIRGLGLFCLLPPSHFSALFFNYFSLLVGFAWASKNAQHSSKGELVMSSLFINCTLFEGFLLMPSLTGLQVFRRTHIKPD